MSDRLFLLSGCAERSSQKCLAPAGRWSVQFNDIAALRAKAMIALPSGCSDRSSAVAVLSCRAVDQTGMLHFGASKVSAPVFSIMMVSTRPSVSRCTPRLRTAPRRAERLVPPRDGKRRFGGADDDDHRITEIVA